MAVKQIIYINKTKFTCGFVENLCKEQNVSCYTLQDCNDFSYLIDDLKPEAVIIDGQTYQESEDTFWNCSNAAEFKTCFILLSNEKNEKFTTSMPLPINPVSFLQELTQKLESI